MTAFGKVGKAYQTSKRFFGKAANAGLVGSRRLGKGFGDLHHTYQVGKRFTRNAANTLDKKLGTHGAIRSLADTGIHAVGASQYGQAIKSGLGEAEYQNNRLQGGLKLLGAQ
jgi:hypothetical protein